MTGPESLKADCQASWRFSVRREFRRRLQAMDAEIALAGGPALPPPQAPPEVSAQSLSASTPAISAAFPSAGPFQSIGVRLLADIKALFDQTDADCMPSAILIGKLSFDPDSRWAKFNDGKKLTQRQLAGLLKPFFIFSGTVHPAGMPHANGYKRHQFEDAWKQNL
jgi:hypothetical protein